MAVFFNPSPKFKEYIILDLIEHDENITQRKLSEKVNSSVSMINLYLDNYEKDNLIYRDVISPRNIKYKLTKILYIHL